MSVPLLKQYQEYLDKLAGVHDDCSESSFMHHSLPSSLEVGIVGGGMAGLYSAMLLQHYIPGVKVKIYEAGDRVGGCIYTHRFSPDPYQYFEAGAMRIPAVESHQPVFTLMDYLNKQFPGSPIKLIDFMHVSSEGNRVLVNNAKQKDGHIMSAMYAAEHGSELGFPKVVATDGISAGKLI